MKASELDKLPSRLKYYLLEWKDANMGDFIRKYGDKKLRDLSMSQLHGLFCYAARRDFEYLHALTGEELETKEA